MCLSANRCIMCQEFSFLNNRHLLKFGLDGQMKLDVSGCLRNHATIVNRFMLQGYGEGRK